jgi:hypothetical protein
MCVASRRCDDWLYNELESRAVEESAISENEDREGEAAVAGMVTTSSSCSVPLLVCVEAVSPDARRVCWHCCSA